MTLPCSFKWLKWEKPPRLLSDLMRSLKPNGGLGLPDLFLYYQATSLLSIIKWNLHTHGSKLWVPLEKTMAGRNLVQALQLPCVFRGLSDSVSPISIATLTIWDGLNRKLSLSWLPLPLSPLGGYPWFTPGENLAFFKFWGGAQKMCCFCFMTGTNLKSLVEFHGEWGVPPWDNWKHI